MLKKASGKQGRSEEDEDKDVHPEVDEESPLPMGSLFIPDKLREKIKKVTDQLELSRKQGLGLGKRKDYGLDKQRFGTQ